MQLTTKTATSVARLNRMKGDKLIIALIKKLIDVSYTGVFSRNMGNFDASTIR